MRIQFAHLKFLLVASVLLAPVALPALVHAQQATPANRGEGAPASAASDPWLWLEDVGGEKPMSWVREQNARTDATLARGEQFGALQADILSILDSDAKIPYVRKSGQYYYNFWRDAQHERGLWRRTTVGEYRRAAPAWETVLDLDALSAQESENWVWRGAECLRPDYRRCLVNLSRGGADATVTREFDLVEKQWVEDGFFRPEAKGELVWIDIDNVYVTTDFGAGSTTDSGYPRMVKHWQRGTPLSAAKTVFEGQAGDVSVEAISDLTPGYERFFFSRTIEFWNDELFLVGKAAELIRIDAPNSATKTVHRDWLILQLREPYQVGDSAWPAGALLAIRFDAFLAGKRDFDVLFTPSDSASLESYTWTRSQLVLGILEDVKSRIVVLTPGGKGWESSALPGTLEIGSLSAWAVDEIDSDALWLSATGYLTPSTLALVQPGETPEVLKSTPAFFDASTHVVEQHFAQSEDGTRVPYFIVRPKDLAFDGSAPTLLYGYGGFELALTPAYSGIVGKSWLERGGVYAVANIRGGGEYGPRWHQAALKENRHKSYEDFAAIARDLVARKITSPAHLGGQGGSNGGLLIGNMLVRYPELFGALLIEVPLLDMQRYSQLLAGASWMVEYGNPQTADWEYIRTFSPYQLFDANAEYPPTMIWTTTRDDRVHPGHARKMAAKMLAADKDVLYFENVEGGHGAGGTNRQKAHVLALAYSFLWRELGARPRQE